MLEVDYVNKLTPEEQAWLFAYNESNYGGNGAIMYADHEEVKRLWRENKKSQIDGMNGAVHDLPLENRAGPGNVEDTMIALLDGHDMKQMKDRARVSREKQDRVIENELIQKQKIKRRKKAMMTKKKGN